MLIVSEIVFGIKMTRRFEISLIKNITRVPLVTGKEQPM